MMSGVVSQVTWQGWRACDLGNDNHIAQAPLSRGAETGCRGGPGSSRPALRGNEPVAVPRIWSRARARTRDPLRQGLRQPCCREPAPPAREGSPPGPPPGPHGSAGPAPAYFLRQIETLVESTATITQSHPIEGTGKSKKVGIQGISRAVRPGTGHPGDLHRVSLCLCSPVCTFLSLTSCPAWRGRVWRLPLGCNLRVATPV